MVRERPRWRDDDPDVGVRDLLREQVRLCCADKGHLDLLPKRLLYFGIEHDHRRDGVRALDVDGQRNSPL